jgi:hypothetical protein
MLESGVCLNELHQNSKELFLELMQEILFLKDEGVI